MKATMEIPDELYRQVKAKSALEGRRIREVAVELFQRYVGLGEPSELEPGDRDAEVRQQIDDEPAPEWFGVLRRSARRVKRHDMEAVREMTSRFRNFDQFCDEVLKHRSGPLASAVEDMADEMYRQEIVEEFDTMWDSHDTDDE